MDVTQWTALEHASLCNVIAAELRRANIPACSIGIVDRSGHTEPLALGMADVRHARRATPNTAYHLYSGTKLYTATAVMQLVEANRLALDVPAADFVPDILDSSRVTVRQLLNHTSGLADTLRAFLSVHPSGDPPV